MFEIHKSPLFGTISHTWYRLSVNIILYIDNVLTIIVHKNVHGLKASVKIWGLYKIGIC